MIIIKLKINFKIKKKILTKKYKTKIKLFLINMLIDLI